MKKIILAILFLFALFVGYFFVGNAEPAQKISWGVNFSQKYAELLGLDWQKAYLALLDDLGVDKIKILTHWDQIEKKEGEYDFKDLDWQLEEAAKREADVLLVIGMKTGHWPECHISEWAKDRSKEEQQADILKLIETIVLRYKDWACPHTITSTGAEGAAMRSGCSFGVGAWQVENEPLFPFGECPWRDKSFLKKEISLVKSLDPEKPVIISDSGEFSFWITAARLGDMVSATLHRKVWFKEIKNYLSYPVRPVFYWRKAGVIKKLFGKEVFIGELQAEPWCPNFIYPCSLEEQKKTMDLTQFRKNIQFAEETGFNTVYLWGAEWWYWMKEIQNDSRIWNEAKRLFQG